MEKKLHTIKVLLIVCLLTGLIRGIKFSIGTTHDFQMYKDGEFEFPESLKLSVDLGFLGIKKLHNNVSIPEKASKLNPLTEKQKKENKKKSSKRVPIEHKNRCCKIFYICSYRYRGKHMNYEDNWKIVVALVNLKIITYNQRFYTL